jgi:hypothetical protein
MLLNGNRSYNREYQLSQRQEKMLEPTPRFSIKPPQLHGILQAMKLQAEKVGFSYATNFGGR